MKNIVLIITLLLYINAVCYCQPTGEMNMANMEISFTDEDKDILFFEKDSIYRSNEDIYEVTFLEVRLDSSSANNILPKERKRVPQLQENKIFAFVYFPSINNNKENSMTFTPKKNIIVFFRKNNCLMKIYIKLYNVKSEFLSGSKIKLTIPFKKGVYEVNDHRNPKLVKIKNE